MGPHPQPRGGSREAGLVLPQGCEEEGGLCGLWLRVARTGRGAEGVCVAGQKVERETVHEASRTEAWRRPHLGGGLGGHRARSATATEKQVPVRG